MTSWVIIMENNFLFAGVAMASRQDNATQIKTNGPLGVSGDKRILSADEPSYSEIIPETSAFDIG